MKKIIALSAAVGMLGATAAMSQTNQMETQPQATPPQTSPQTTMPPVGTPPSPQMQKEPGAEAKTAPGQQSFLSQQQTGQIMASDMMRKNILGANNERIGDVNDLVLSKDGQVAAVVIGVGGFLGIGEKTVAIPFDDLQMSPGTDQITTQLSREDLEQAPQFVTNKSRERSTTGTGTTGTTGTGSGTQR